MPYIIITAHGEELERKELTGPITIGRSPECDVSVRDVLMSRQHCRVEPATGRDKGRWRLVDLKSSNGCHVNHRKVETYTLVEGDSVRIGRSRITFRSGPFKPAPQNGEAPKKRSSRLVRPADPHEALSGTVADFVYHEPDAQSQEFDATPSPPSDGRRAGLIAQSSTSDPNEGPGSGGPWNPGTTTATGATSATKLTTRTGRPTARPIPRPMGADLSLQVLPSQIPFMQEVPALPKRRRGLVPALILALGLCLATLIVLLSGWIMAHSY
jgi:pSer/pThr/pTyr-binding forkhead associated (FHA) protein